MSIRDNPDFARRHYEILARVIGAQIAYVRENYAGNVPEAILKDLAGELAEQFANDNPRFDVGRFLNTIDRWADVGRGEAGPEYHRRRGR